MAELPDFMKEIMGNYTGDDGWQYRCTKCKYPMERIVVQTMAQNPRKLFFCGRKQCERFGLVTVVANKTK